MTCRFLMGFCASFLLMVGTTAADPQPDQPQPPVRLKKKTRPAAEPVPKQKPTPSSKDVDPPPTKTIPKKPSEPPSKEPEAKDAAPLDEGQELEAKIRETIERVAKNMQRSEERLAKHDSGAGTQQVQRDILQDLDSLIEQNRQQQQQQSSSSASSSQSQRQQARRQRSSRNRSTVQRSKPGAGKEPSGQGVPEKLGGGRNDRDDMSQIADLYKDIWGHLPATLRQEMDQYAREQFMAKYSDLLKQYYATIAEKGRRKGE